MSGAEVLDVARDAVLTLVLVASPLMLIGLIVGVVISLFQALTQIQEMTLVFVPKILAIFVAMLVALPFMSRPVAGVHGAGRRAHHLDGKRVGMIPKSGNRCSERSRAKRETPIRPA